MHHLHCFFALTRTSVYKISDEIDAQGLPIVEKIVTIGKSGVPIGGRLEGGRHVGLAGESGIILFDPYPESGDHGPDMVVRAMMNGKTSAIVGLFLEETEAKKSLFTPNLEANDPRFQEKSARVLGAIGTDHPVFVISELHYKNQSEQHRTAAV